MEQKLKRLFDYQKFARNPRLDAMLAEAEGRYAGGLSDDDLELVSAAGDSQMMGYEFVEGETSVGAFEVLPEECL